MLLKIENLTVKVQDKLIVKDASLNVSRGEIVVLMGPNGSGKTTLAYAIMGHPRYQVVKGRILFKGEDITALPPHERAKKGIFLVFQNPPEIYGVKVKYLLDFISVNRDYSDLAEKLGFSAESLHRDLNVGFSGGERKRLEVLQMLLTKPAVAILDEPDSGVDIDSVKIIADAIRELVKEDTGILLITHYTKLARYLSPSRVYVMFKGRIVTEGSIDLMNKIDRCGYQCIDLGKCSLERCFNE
ncbi:MAG: Fe-S cluster assembly ATPase SufC [Thermoprotei archaeon]|nr:MAG: Fe-S cluster assembly ATPase SufC [Thermoprotei archaeon]RLE99883.1 MAG: Fe-S cluster assembly ATPase SufC [Thermoprotei archaeon]HDI74687.1 Fe-S cluster assembly ATPase SufC [Thermoprotei archaeon]